MWVQVPPCASGCAVHRKRLIRTGGHTIFDLELTTVFFILIVNAVHC